MSADIARLTRERDEARERAASLSRELLTAIRARDSYRASAELRVGMRREFEELLNVGDTTAPETFEAGLVRLRALLAAESRAEKAERERDAYRHEWNVSSRQQGAETRARYAAEAKAERLAKALRHCARELQYVLDADPCEQREIHQSGEAKACVALAESLLGPMRGWPEGPNAGMLAALAEVAEVGEVSEKTFPVPLCSTVEGMQWLYNTATDNFIRGLRDANAELAALRAENERLRAAATEALAVLTRLADSAYQWAGRDVPVGLVSEVDSAKARLAGVLAMVAAPEGEKEGERNG